MAYPTVNFLPTTPFMGVQPISSSAAAQAHPLGTIIRAQDVTYGEGEFIYLAGVVGTAAGDAVCFDQRAGTTVRAVHGGAGVAGALAVAMSANGAGHFGWYAISGAVPVKSGTVVAATAPYLTSTAGQLDDAVVAGDEVSGILIVAADTGGFCTAQLGRPSISGIGGGSTVPDASATQAGVVTTGAQTFAGVKNFSSAPQAATYASDGTVPMLQNSSNDTILRSGAAGTSGNVYLSNQSEHFAVVNNAGIELIASVAQSFIFRSPDGTRYKLVVANGGGLTATPA